MLSDLSLRTSSDLKKKWQKTYRERIPFSFLLIEGDLYDRSFHLSFKRTSRETRRVVKSSEGKWVYIYFTSLHIPEDDPNTYKELIQILGDKLLHMKWS